jgi:hypothetical protein
MNTTTHLEHLAEVSQILARRIFQEMSAWLPADISEQVRQMIASVAPGSAKVAEFEAARGDVFRA